MMDNLQHISDFELWDYLIYFDDYQRLRNENQTDLPIPGLHDKMVEIHLLECAECLNRLKNIQYIKHNPDTAIYEAFPVLQIVKVNSILQRFKDSGKFISENLKSLINTIETDINNGLIEIFSGIFQSELAYFGPKDIENIEIISNLDIKDKIIKFENGMLHLKFKSITQFENAILIASNDFFPGKVTQHNTNNPETNVVFKIYDKKSESNKKKNTEIIEKSYFVYFY